MDRRNFLKTGTAAAMATTAHLEAKAKVKTGKKTRKPNVLYVFSDQHRALSLPGEPFNQALAPTIEAFREQNCSMEQCISNYPLCTPYRGIFMSGLWPYQSGLTHNGAVLDPSVGPLGETFRNAGYHTGYIGKWHLHGEDKLFIPKGPYRMGFEDWHVWSMTNNHYHSWTFNQDTGEKIFPEGWQPTRMTDEAITFLKAQPKDKPWLLVLSWNPPHPPFNPPGDDTAPYPLDQIKFRPNVHLQPKSDVAAGPPHPLSSEDALRTAAQGYMGGITGVDKEFARVLQTLDEIGQADDTIIVYTSDHGEMMGSHGRMAKQVPFEESCRVPFIIRYPGVTVERKKSDVLFAAVDIYPTLCGLAGVPIPSHCVGRDLSDVMRGRRVKEPEHVFLMNEIPHDIPKLKAETHVGVPAPVARRKQGRDMEEGIESHEFTNQPTYRGIRTRTHTYAVADSGRWLLYDNIADPYQLKNLVSEESQRPLMERFDALIEAWMQSVHDPFPYAKVKQEVSNFPS